MSGCLTSQWGQTVFKFQQTIVGGGFLEWATHKKMHMSLRVNFLVIALCIATGADAFATSGMRGLPALRIAPATCRRHCTASLKVREFRMGIPRSHAGTVVQRPASAFGVREARRSYGRGTVNWIVLCVVWRTCNHPTFQSWWGDSLAEGGN